MLKTRHPAWPKKGFKSEDLHSNEWSVSCCTCFIAFFIFHCVFYSGILKPAKRKVRQFWTFGRFVTQAIPDLRKFWIILDIAKYFTQCLVYCSPVHNHIHVFCLRVSTLKVPIFRALCFQLIYFLQPLFVHLCLFQMAYFEQMEPALEHFPLKNRFTWKIGVEANVAFT